MNPKKDFGSYTPDELARLYQEDPELFNELSEEALKKACIAASPEKTLKLQQMQWSIDMQLRRSKTALGRMNIMENIFYTQVYGENGQLERLMGSCNSLVRALTGSERLAARKGGPGRLRKV